MFLLAPLTIRPSSPFSASFPLPFLRTPFLRTPFPRTPFLHTPFLRIPFLHTPLILHERNSTHLTLHRTHIFSFFSLWSSWTLSSPLSITATSYTPVLSIKPAPCSYNPHPTLTRIRTPHAPTLNKTHTLLSLEPSHPSYNTRT
jgi:hypothetical protein